MGLRNFQSMFKLTNKQTIYSFNDIQAPDLHTAQYYNITKDRNVNHDNNKNYKNYLHGRSSTPCGGCLIRKTLSGVKNTFEGAHNLNFKIS